MYRGPLFLSSDFKRAVQVEEEEQQCRDRYDQRDCQPKRIRTVLFPDGVVLALQESGGFQRGGDRLVQQEDQRGVEHRFRHIEREEQGNDQRFDVLDGYVHVERRDEKVCTDHDGGHHDDGQTHAEQCTEHIARARVDEAADADENDAGEDVHDVAVDAGAADGHKLDGGNEQGHGEAVRRSEEHGSDGHDGVLEIEGKERDFEMEENAADVRQCGEYADCGERADLLVGEGFFC